MNIGFWSCIILVIPFLIIGVLFAIFKEKAAKFVSGFNSRAQLSYRNTISVAHRNNHRITHKKNL